MANRAHGTFILHFWSFFKVKLCNTWSFVEPGSQIDSSVYEIAVFAPLLSAYFKHQCYEREKLVRCSRWDETVWWL